MFFISAPCALFPENFSCVAGAIAAAHVQLRSMEDSGLCRRSRYLPAMYTDRHTYFVYIYIHFYIVTSSTAQGGGGSFKNRKPIGEVGCCESGIAERSH